jgi:glyoxylase-like metal-dependent hydrolase (beta-lactamase superfamily II)
MRRIVLLGVLLIAGAIGTAAQQSATQAPGAAPAQSEAATIEKLRDNLFVIKGGGGNTAAFVTSAGVVLVDTKLANWGSRIMDQVRSVTDKPVTTIINTHTHGDHTGSNEFFPASVEVVAHENTKVNMQKMPAFQGEKAQFVPDRTFKETVTLFTGGDRVELRYFGAGHTNGDAIVVFPALRVAHTGDLFPRKGTPLIDVNNGGSGVAYAETLKKAAAGITGVEQVIPGHSDVTPWSGFVEFAEFNAAFLSATRAAMEAGKSVEEAVAGLRLPDTFQAYVMTGAKDNVAKIYAELKK